MTIWKPPHISKIYEALSAIADKRIEFVSENQAHCISTSRGKYYTITYDPSSSSVMSNDNTAYYSGKLSYPIIAFLMLKDIIKYNKHLLPPLQNIPWKDINQRFKDDYDQGLNYYFQNLFPKDLNIQNFKLKITSIFSFTCGLKLNYFGKKTKPPSGY